MGKRRIAIEKIEKRESRNVTFCKRRQGLFKKASALCTLCDARIAIIVFSPSAKNNVYTFGDPDIELLLDRFYNNNTNNHISSNNSVFKEEEEEEDNGSKKAEKQGGFLWWDNMDFSQFDSVEKLQRLESDLQDAKQRVVNQLKKFDGSSSSSPQEDEVKEGSEWLWPSVEVHMETLLNNSDLDALLDNSEYWQQEEEGIFQC